ncbi:MAG: lipopolysaccharide heptosyltransferase II [Deltaproteobacteria bacterium]|nr:lipopolysaccharide heptosyltransferase II [Deltaproteobacteria bacterium]
MKTPKSILIIKLSAIGDVVHALPFLDVLRKNFPDARIDWLVEEQASQIISGHSGLDRVIVSRRNLWKSRLLHFKSYMPLVREVSEFLKELRSYEYDLVIDLQGLLKSGVLVGLSKGKRKIGMGGAREGGWIFLNERPVPVDYEQHAIVRYLRVAGYLDCDFSSWKGDIPVSGSDKKWVNDLLNAKGNNGQPLVAINPMARWKTKLWESERFAVLADRITNELSCEVLFTGSNMDRNVIEDISKKMKVQPMNLAGRTSLKQLAYLFTRCAALVTTDTGPMHIGAAMGCRVVALFGPTAPWRTGPYGQSHKVIRADLECSPCFKKKCNDMRCMKDITVDRVFEAVKNTVIERS